MPREMLLPDSRNGDFKSSAIRVVWTPSAGRLDIDAWYDHCVGMETTSMSLRKFFDRLGITEKDCKRAWKEAVTEPMTPERLEEIRKYSEREKFRMNHRKIARMVADLLAEVDRLRKVADAAAKAEDTVSHCGECHPPYSLCPCCWHDIKGALIAVKAANQRPISSGEH